MMHMVQSYDQLKEMPWLTFMSTVELSQSVQSTSVGQRGGVHMGLMVTAMTWMRLYFADGRQVLP
jgi:hypothetical protein